MAVARITQVIGSSPHSWEDAVRNALERANRTLRNITGIEVLKENAAIEDGKIAEYRATVQVTFVVLRGPSFGVNVMVFGIVVIVEGT